jgi:hypothetical protein
MPVSLTVPDHCAQEILLPVDPSDVLQLEGAAAAHVLQRSLAVHLVVPALEDDVAQLGIGFRRFRNVDGDAPQRIDDVLEPGPVDDGQVIHADPGEVLDRRLVASRAIGRERRVDLVLADGLAGLVVDLHVRVTRDRQQVGLLPVLRDVHHHDRVAAVLVGRPGVGGHRLRDGVRSWAVVRTGEQNRDGTGFVHLRPRLLRKRRLGKRVTSPKRLLR